jgi:hypothetical protein
LFKLGARSGTVAVNEIAENIIDLFKALALPRAFYTRLINPKIDAYPRVESFFRDVVDPVITSMGFERIEVGTDRTEHPYINADIFEGLHFASVAVIDVTGERPNCFIELGYALGRQMRLIITAEDGTNLPFDQQPMPCHLWTHGEDDATRRDKFIQFWRNNIDRPPLVKS